MAISSLLHRVESGSKNSSVDIENSRRFRAAGRDLVDHPLKPGTAGKTDLQNTRDLDAPDSAHVSSGPPPWQPYRKHHFSGGASPAISQPSNRHHRPSINQ